MSTEKKKDKKDNAILKILKEASLLDFEQYIESEDFELAEKNILTNIEMLKKMQKIVRNEIDKHDQRVEINQKLSCYTHEGAYAIYEAVKEIYGEFDMNESGPSGDRPPSLINVKLSDGTFVKVPWGTVALPSFDSDSYIEMSYNEYDHTFHIVGTIKRRNQEELDKLFDVVKKKLKNSIYTGKAINITFDSEDDDCYMEPTFLDLSNIEEDKIFLSKSSKEDLVPILTRIKNTKQCREIGLDLKYGALMSGPYGTGKTLTAFLIARIAIDNGWTFLYLKDCNHLEKTLRIAENFISQDKGVVIFTEDIDQALRGERDADMQGILNTIDGGDTKGLPIISIFTTNHIEKIEPTFLRGKRIGGLITLGALDEESAFEFVQKGVRGNNGANLIDENQMVEASKYLIGIVPAFASEVIDKAKAFMVSRNANKISAEDIQKAVESYKVQMQHAELKKTSTDEEEIKKAFEVISRYMGKA